MKSSDRLRVVLISFDFREYCIRLANALSADADVLLFLPQDIVGSDTAKPNDNVRLYSFVKARIRQPLRQFRTIRAILRAIKDFSPDVVHYQGVHLWFDLTLPLLRRYPLVFTIHDFRPHPGDQLLQQTPFFIEMFARRRADQIIVHTRHTQELIAGELRCDGHNISIIPHIQIGEEFGSSAAQEEEHLLLFFGRIWEYKGLEYLIRAEPLISARVPDVRILIAGRGEDFSRYTRMMANPNRFIVHNAFVSDARAAEYFQRASIVVLPYIEASQSGVIPMAYSAGKPVVATTVGGLPEMVEHGRTGYLVAPRDETQLAEAIAALLLDTPLRRQMGANGKRKIETECSPQVIARRTIDVYRRAVGGTARAPKRMQIRLAATAQQSKASTGAKQ
jgi:glycosyltransferase involved in cell wall biosynthesis